MQPSVNRGAGVDGLLASRAARRGAAVAAVPSPPPPAPLCEAATSPPWSSPPLWCRRRRRVRHFPAVPAPTAAAGQPPRGRRGGGGLSRRGNGGGRPPPAAAVGRHRRWRRCVRVADRPPAGGQAGAAPTRATDAGWGACRGGRGGATRRRCPPWGPRRARRGAARRGRPPQPAAGQVGGGGRGSGTIDDRRWAGELIPPTGSPARRRPARGKQKVGWRGTTTSMGSRFRKIYSHKRQVGTAGRWPGGHEMPPWTGPR